MGIEFETTAELSFVLKAAGIGNADAVAKMVWKEKERFEYATKASSALLTEKEKQNIDAWKASRVKKQRKKYGKKRFMVQTAYWGIIYKLRQDGFSYEEIAKYLLRYHKFKVHSTTLERYFVEKMKLMES